MTQTVCQTRDVGVTEELSQAAGCNTTVAAESAAANTQPQQLVLWELDRQQVTVDFSAGSVVTDTGLLAVRKLDRELGILEEAAARLADPRSQKFVKHDVQRLLVQQVYQLLGGYFDANDADVLRHDPLFQTLAERSPEVNNPLADRKSTRLNSSDRTISYAVFCLKKKKKKKNELMQELDAVIHLLIEATHLVLIQRRKGTSVNLR